MKPNVETLLCLLSLCLMTRLSQVGAASIIGQVHGTFRDAIGGADANVIGTNSSTLTWGIPFVSGTKPNKVSFDSGPVDSPTETPFRIGTLSFFNGTVQATSGIDSFNLRLEFQIESHPAISFHFPLTVIGSRNTEFSIESADTLRLTHHQSTERRLLNGREHQLTIWFTNPGFGAFTHGDGIGVLEDYEATAELWGIFSTQTSPDTDFIESVISDPPNNQASLYSSRWEQSQAALATGGDSIEIDMADYNGDQLDDLIVLTSRNLQFFAGNGTGTLTTSKTN